MKPERNVERMTPVAVIFLKIDRGTMAAKRTVGCQLCMSVYKEGRRRLT